VLASTPAGSYKWSQQTRYGTLTIAPDGSISGEVRVIDSGDLSLMLRDENLVYGLAKVKQMEQKYWNSQVPAGMQMKVDHFLGMNSTDTTLMEILDVSGTVGTKAGNLRIIPGNLLEAGQKPLFSSPTRTMPIDLGPEYMTQDQVTVTLPANYKLQGLPKNGSLQFLPNTAYRSLYKVAGNTYRYQRVSVVATAEYLPASYAQLKGYFQQVSQDDRQPMVFQVSAMPVRAAAAAVKGASAGHAGAKQ
jgi:hypothetical protein